jgi:hypothetical protein
MYDRSWQKFYAKRTASRAYNYLMYYRHNITTNGQYTDNFKSSLKNNILSTIRYLSNLL